MKKIPEETLKNNADQSESIKETFGWVTEDDKELAKNDVIFSFHNEAKTFLMSHRCWVEILLLERIQ